MKRIECSAMVVLAALSLAAMACGQPLTTAEETQTAHAGLSPVASATMAVASTTPNVTTVAATATAQPTPPSPPQIPSPTSIDVSGTPAAAAARSDCPSDWFGYGDTTSLLSLCYPSGWTLNVSFDAGQSPMAFRLVDTANGTFIGISVVDSTPMSVGTVVSLAELCGAFSKVAGIPFSEDPIQLANVQGSSCRGHGDAGEEGIDPIHGFVTLPGGRYLQLYITRGSNLGQLDADISALLTRIKAQ